MWLEEKYIYDCKRHPLIPILNEKKEKPNMKVYYNGFTGELVKLEQHDLARYGCTTGKDYSISIYDSEKRVTHSFTGVKMEDVKFLGGAVVFDG